MEANLIRLFNMYDDIIMFYQILYLTAKSSENKIIVFSQWPHVLDILAAGCDKNRICYRKLEKGQKGQESNHEAVVLFNS